MGLTGDGRSSTPVACSRPGSLLHQAEDVGNSPAGLLGREDGHKQVVDDEVRTMEIGDVARAARASASIGIRSNGGGVSPGTTSRGRRLQAAPPRRSEVEGDISGGSSAGIVAQCYRWRGGRKAARECEGLLYRRAGPNAAWHACQGSSRRRTDMWLELLGWKQVKAGKREREKEMGREDLIQRPENVLNPFIFPGTYL